eukprot:TRINITY_DN3688_c0_g1_i3.p1 TRINITY_DN3688_c0_g1~~TRINITY_DN3688_c0_g1_i3.p1  ORF type:complete len:309 (+),score=37.17 TRINITY_DN3688_c0_g1_i3:7-933(+)
MRRWRRIVGKSIDLLEHYSQMRKKLFSLGGVSDGNRVKLYCDSGKACFEDMFHTILNAKRRVWLSTYIFSADRTGYLTIKHLKKARENGCEIVIIFDSIGSSIKEHHLNELRQAGALLYEFNPFTKAEHWWDWRKRLGHPYKRNHQKILICDDVGFCGGMNIGNEYADIKPVGENFRDTHLKIEGPAVRDLQHAFIDCLSEVKDTYGIDEIHNNIVANFKKEPSIPPFQDGSTVQVLQSNVWQNHRAIQRAKRLTMLYAKERCYLTTPYFLPPLLLRVPSHLSDKEAKILTLHQKRTQLLELQDEEWM